MRPAYADARALSAAMVRGEESAWAAFCDRWTDHAIAIARNATGRDESWCMDVVQDALIRAVRTIRVVESENQLGAWVASLVKSAAVDRYRSESRRARRERDRQDAPGSSGPDRDEVERLIAAINELPATDRDLLLRRLCRDQTLRSIADADGVTIGQTHGRLRRLVTKLRSTLGATE
ncbi:MAG: sigma-70 family RNA polymerase sigma factor [Planctomycetota bacterium]